MFPEMAFAKKWEPTNHCIIDHIWTYKPPFHMGGVVCFAGLATSKLNLRAISRVIIYTRNLIMWFITKKPSIVSPSLPVQ